jgi:microcystin-dependent protein
MSYTLDSLLDQAIDNYPVTATLAPEVVAVLFYALSEIQDPYSWLDPTQDPLDEITDTDYSEILELLGAANVSIITPEVGFIKPYITTSPPDNTLPCDGGTHARLDYPLLYAVLDSIFIVDADTFYVPDLSGTVMLGTGTLGAFTYAVGDTGGENDHTLTTAEIASHSHVADAPTVIDPTHTHVYTSAIPIPLLEGAVPAPGAAIPSPGVTAPALTGISVLAPNIHNEGGGGAHENRQPFFAVKYCVQAR